jgi:hypothetical protein
MMVLSGIKKLTGLLAVGVLCTTCLLLVHATRPPLPFDERDIAIRKNTRSGYVGRVMADRGYPNVISFIGINTTVYPTPRFAESVLINFPEDNVWYYEGYSVPLSQQSTGGLTDLVKSRTVLARGSGFSEQAITMTISKKREEVSETKPTIVVFHGGADSIGGGDMIDPLQVVEDTGNPVVVFNYRLGKYGWLGIDGATNLGLKDQINQLCFLRAYGKYFGIDRSEITVYGYSAGAGNIATLMAARDKIRCPGTSGPIHLWKNSVLLDQYYGLTALKPSAKAIGLNRPKAQAEYIAEAAGCSSASAAAMLNCLRTVPTSVMDFLQFIDYWSGLTFYAFAEWWPFPSNDGDLIRSDDLSDDLRNYKAPDGGSITFVLAPYQGAGLCTPGVNSDYTGTTAATAWSTRTQYRQACYWRLRHLPPEQIEPVCQCGGDRSFLTAAPNGCLPALGTVLENLLTGEPNFINATFAICTSTQILTPALRTAQILTANKKNKVFVIATTVQSNIAGGGGPFNQFPPHGQWNVILNTTAYYALGSHGGPFTGSEQQAANIQTGFLQNIMKYGTPADPTVIKSNFTEMGQPGEYTGIISSIAQVGSSSQPRSDHAIGGLYNTPGCDVYASTPLPTSNTGWYGCLTRSLDPKLYSIFAFAESLIPMIYPDTPSGH